MGELTRARTSWVLGVAAVVVLALATAALAAEVQAEIDVRDSGLVDQWYEPETVTIEAGETVRWRWHEDNVDTHTVTSDDGLFDSDQPCDDEGRLATECRQHPYVFEVTFAEPGTYQYHCKRHGPEAMGGTVEVVPAPSPSPSPDDDDPEPSPSPSPDDDDPEPSPSPTDDPENGSDDDDDEAAPDDDSEGDENAADRSGDTTGSSGQASRPPAQRTTPSEDDADAVAVADPDVAPPEPDFEPFPTPSPVDPPPSPEIDEDLAVDIPPPGGIPRDTLIVIAFATLAATLGVFGKVVLFGGSWG